MGSRVTNSILLRTTLGEVTRQRVRLARVQEQAASGLRINRPSDDPVGARSAAGLRASIDASLQFQRNQSQGQERLRATESALDRALDVVSRARQLAVSGATGTLDARSREALSAEVAQLHGELVSAANAKLSGGYLFGGYANGAQPFTQAGDFSAVPAPVVSFVGDPNEVEVEVDDGIRLPVTVDGRRAFLGDADGDGNPDAGREDVFLVIGDLWEALQLDDPVAVGNTLDGLDRAQLQLSLERTRIGAASQRLENAQSSVGDREFESRRRLSEVEDADSVEVFSELVSQETALTASLDAMARVIQPSLLDFLR